MVRALCIMHLLSLVMSQFFSSKNTCTHTYWSSQKYEWISLVIVFIDFFCSSVLFLWTLLKSGFSFKRKQQQLGWMEWVFPNIEACWVLWPPLPRKKVCRHFGKALFQDYNASVFMEAYGLAYMVLWVYYMFFSWILLILMLSQWHKFMCIHKLHVEQVKGYLVGSEFIGEIPLYHKILAAFLTGENVSHFPACCSNLHTTCINFLKLLSPFPLLL